MAGDVQLTDGPLLDARAILHGKCTTSKFVFASNAGALTVRTDDRNSGFGVGFGASGVWHLQRRAATTFVQSV